MVARDASDVGCHVIRVSRTRKRRSDGDKPRSFRVHLRHYVQQISCDTLPQAQVSRITEALEDDERAAYTTGEVRRSARRTLWALVDELGLSGIAVLRFRAGQGPELLSAVRVPFQPLALGRADLALRAFLPDGETVSKTIWRSRAERLFSHQALFALGLLVWLLLFLGLLYEFQNSSTGGAKVGLVLLPVALIGAVYLISRLGCWFVVPGGVVVREYKRWGMNLGLQRFTPRDSLLEISRETHRWGVWTAWLTPREGDARRSKVAFISTLEVRILLAAWQSPLEPPPVDRCSDLR